MLLMSEKVLLLLAFSVLSWQLQESASGMCAGLKEAGGEGTKGQGGQHVAA